MTVFILTRKNMARSFLCWELRTHCSSDNNSNQKGAGTSSSLRVINLQDFLIYLSGVAHTLYSRFGTKMVSETHFKKTSLQFTCICISTPKNCAHNSAGFLTLLITGTRSYVLLLINTIFSHMLHHCFYKGTENSFVTIGLDSKR